MFKKEKLSADTIKVVSYLLIFLPVALAFLFVYLCGVNVVFGDQWGMAVWLDRLATGTLSVSDVFLSSFGGQRQGLHNIFFPQVAMLLLGVATSYNALVLMYFILGCFLVTLVSIWLVFKDSLGQRASLLSLILFVPIPFLVFTLRQHENMLWGFQLTLAFAQTFSVLAFYFLHVSERTRFKKAGFLAALGSGTVATFSATPGVFVWPAGLVQLLVTPMQKSTKMLRIAAWSLIGAGELVVYFRGFASDTGHDFHDFLERPIREMNSFLTLLGHSLFGQQSYAFFSGALLVSLVAVIPLLVYKDRKPVGYSLWLALLLFSFLVLASITVGRGGPTALLNSRYGAFSILVVIGVYAVLVSLLVYKGRRPVGYSFWLALLLFSFLVLASITVGRGGPTALNSRYVTFSVLAVIGIYVVLVKSVLDRKSYAVTGLLGILSVLIVLSIPGSYSEGIEIGTGTGETGAVEFKETTAYRERAAFILATYESQPDEFLIALNPRPEIVRRVAPALEGLGYSVFSEARPRALPPPLSELSLAPSSTLSEVESVSGVEVGEEDQPIVVSAEEPFIEVTGWAVDAEAEDAAGGVYLDVDGELFPAFYGTDKDGSDTRDLADYYGVPSYGRAVFERAVPVSEIGTGRHQLSVIVLSHDKERYYRTSQEVAFEVR